MDTLAKKVDAARSAVLKLSREVPYRQCSPYGHLQVDEEKIRTVARQAYEALIDVQKRLNMK